MALKFMQPEPISSDDREQLEDDLKTIERLKVKAWKFNDPVAMFMICARERDIKKILGVHQDQKQEQE